ncbi:radical SAM protein [Candidatus Dependentiae bacterium]|nr:radical SAM protein [Candidatus Dependentiae bacterium]
MKIDRTEQKLFHQIKNQNFQLSKLAVTDKNSKIQHYPLSVYLETSLKCNLKCIMCPGHSFNKEDKTKGQDFGILSPEIFKKITPLFPYLDRCILSGDGEPFLNMHLLKYLKELKRHQIFVGFITNGILLKKETATKLIELGVDQITFSIDSLEKELYEKIRVNAKFEILMENIKYLFSEKERLNGLKTNITIAAVLMRSNYKEMRKFIKFASDWGINQVLFNPLIRYPDDRYLRFYDDNCLTEENLQNLKTEIPDLIDYSRKLRVDFVLAFFPGIRDLPERKKFKGDIICSEPWTTMFITWDGHVRTCCLNETSLGFLKEDSIENIWFSKKYQDLRDEITSGKIVNPFCVNCIKTSRQDFIINEIEKILFSMREFLEQTW